MKLFTILLLLATSLYSSNLLTYTLPFKEGEIDFKIEGSQKGYATLYFKDFGKEIAIYSTTYSKIFRKKDLDHRLIIVDNDTKIEIDLDTKEAIKTQTLQSSLNEIINNQSDVGKIFNLLTNDKVILNLECKDIEVDGVKECHNGLFALSREIDIFGYKTRLKAIKFKNQKVSKDHFLIPDNLNIIDKRDDLLKAKKVIKSMLE